VTTPAPRRSPPSKPREAPRTPPSQDHKHQAQPAAPRDATPIPTEQVPQQAPPAAQPPRAEHRPTPPTRTPPIEEQDRAAIAEFLQHEPRVITSTTKKEWADNRRFVPKQWARSLDTLARLGFDPEADEPEKLQALLEHLKATGKLQRRYQRAMSRAERDPTCNQPGGWAHTALDAHPIVFDPGGPQQSLNPVAVLRLLRGKVDDNLWKTTFANALLGVDPVLLEQTRPTGRPARRLPSTDAEAHDDLVQSLCDRGWLVPADDSIATLRRPSPTWPLLKSDGVSYRLITDDTNRMDGRTGPNGACDTTQHPYPALPRVSAIAALAVRLRWAHPGSPMWAFTVDISKAFHRIKLSASAAGSLTVSHGDRVLHPTVLSMGSTWSSSHLVAATAAIAQVVRTWDRTTCAVYADDALILVAGDQQYACSIRAKTLDLFNNLGLPCEPTKSPEPSKSAEHCGFTYHLSDNDGHDTVSLKPSTRQAVVTALRGVTRGKPIDLAHAQVLAGRLDFLATASPPLTAWVRAIRQPTLGALQEPGNKRWTTPAEFAAAALRQIVASNTKIRLRMAAAKELQSRPAVVIATDASATGLGAVVITLDKDRPPRTRALHGSFHTRLNDSVEAEPTAVLIVLNYLKDLLSDKDVLLFTDSTTTVAAADKFRASSAARHANHLLTAIASLSLDHNIRLQARHLPGIQNVAADLLSRHGQNAASHQLWPSAFLTLSKALKNYSAWRHCSSPPPAVKAPSTPPLEISAAPFWPTLKPDTPSQPSSRSPTPRDTSSQPPAPSRPSSSPSPQDEPSQTSATYTEPSGPPLRSPAPPGSPDCSQACAADTPTPPQGSSWPSSTPPSPPSSSPGMYASASPLPISRKTQSDGASRETTSASPSQNHPWTQLSRPSLPSPGTRSPAWENSPRCRASPRPKFRSPTLPSPSPSLGTAASPSQ